MFLILFDFCMVLWWQTAKHLSRLVTKPTKWLCAQRRLRSALASTQSDQSLRCVLAKYPSFLHADSPVWSGSSLGAHAILLLLSQDGSFYSPIWFCDHFFVLVLFCLAFNMISSLGEEGAGRLLLVSQFTKYMYSSSWGQSRTVICDCGTPWHTCDLFLGSNREICIFW